MRLNANGRKLDAWLIYRCANCDATWNLPLLERVPVGSVAVADLQAMEHSDPGWVKAYAFDLALIARHCHRVEMPADIVVSKSAEGVWRADWTEIALRLDASLAPGVRLDRVLALGLGLTRSAVQTLQATGAIRVDAGEGDAERRIVRTFSLRFTAAQLPEALREAVGRGVFPD